MPGRLNTFQKAMLQWNDIHPYNVVHIVEVRGPLDKELLERVISSEITELGLNGFRLNRRNSSYAYTGGDADIALRFVPPAAEDRSAITREVEAELNNPFPADMRLPFRFFAIERPAAFYLGLVYFHAVAGAESIALLLRSIVQRYAGHQGRIFSLPLDLYPKHSALRAIHPSLLAGQLQCIMNQIANLRRSCRPRRRQPEEQVNAFMSFFIAREQFQHLSAAAKRWKVTLNDLFLTIILKAVAPLAESRFQAKRRRQITVASIANIRKDLKVDATHTFGLFLGSFIVSHEVPKDISIEDLARDLRRQTDRIKKYKSYLIAPLELKAAGFFMPMLTPGRRAVFYAKNYPLWAGITNMNLNTIWPMKQGEGSVGYLRGVSTGPITPCVFAVTTVGEQISVGISYRRSIYTPENMRGIVDRFRRAVEDPEGFR